MTFKTLLAASAIALALPGVAAAQVAPASGFATVSAPDAIFGAKAWSAALNQIETVAFKTQADRLKAMNTQNQTLLAQLDKNGDKQVDDAEIQQAQTANSPVFSQITALENEAGPLNQQILTAQAYALDAIAARYNTALQNIVRDRKLSVVLAPGAIVYPNNLDITKSVTAEIDRILPTTPVVPPAGWQPTPLSGQLLNQWREIIQEQQQLAAMQQAQQQAARPPAAAGTPSVTPPAAPQGRAATPPAPARSGPQQPASR